MNNYFKNDEYWKEHIKKPLEEDNWLDDYREYFSNSGLCLDLGCGIGQYTKKIMSYGYTVVSADISKIALNVVKEFNNNVIETESDVAIINKLLPFFEEQFAKNIEETKRLIQENRVGE